MNFFQLTARIVSSLLMVYYLIIILDIILSWVRSPSLGRLKLLTNRLTDPYMRHFRGISWLRFGMLDFSPILGLILLGLILFVTQGLSSGIFPTWYDLVFWIIERIWGLAAFILVFFVILALLRLITLLAARGRRAGWLNGIDRFLFPIVSKFLGIFTHRSLTYPLALSLFAAALILLRLSVEWGLRELLEYLRMRLDGLG